MSPWLVYPLAAFCEIAGCFAFWAWARDARSSIWLLPGVAMLIAFAWLLTRVPVDTAGRAFAAYGGVYIAASVLWLWLVERQVPTRWDLLGLTVSLVGAAIILAGASTRPSE